MTNLQILTMECAQRGITEEVHTYAKWKSMGKIVKKGEKALFHTELWKHTLRKRDAEADDEEVATARMYLCKSYLFGASQVEDLKVKEAKVNV